jgi:type IV pilus assembly protein PilM
MGLFGSKEVIGLDIGSSSIKMAHVKGIGVENRLRKFGVFPLPADSIVDGAIMDHAAVVEGIQTAMRELKVHEKEVAISLSGHSVIIKKVQLATTTAEELEESIQWEVEQYIPFDIKDVKIDFQVIGPLKDDPTKMDVLLVAAKTDLINDYISVVKEAGRVPRIVDIDSLAAGNAFELTHPVSDEQVPMVVNVGASFMNINVLHAGVPLFTRGRAHGRGDVHFRDPEADGGELRDGRGVQDREEGPGGAIRQARRDHEGRLQPARDGSAEVLQLLLRHVPRPPGDQGLPDGRGRKSTFLKEILAEKIGVGVEIFDSIQGLSVDEKTVDPAVVSQFNTSATVSIGLALRNLEGHG